jgi:glycosyltransferase involved in cell wall biosynthesis
MTADVDVSVVVPVHNAGHHLESLVASVAQTGLSTQVVLVDDASTDDSADVIRRLAAAEDVTAVYLEDNQGAGAARNHGFLHASGRYCLFFDADDSLHPAALRDAVTLLDSNGADVAVLTYRYRGRPDGNEGMSERDQEIWEQYLPPEGRRLASLRHIPRLLLTTNFPWNKVLRTDHFRAAGLRFGTTPVHNDILGHWHLLLFSRKIQLLAEDLCTHVVEPDAGNLTNRNSRTRLALIDALDETYTLLEAHPDLRHRYANQYWDFATHVMGWAQRRIDPALRSEFRRRRSEHVLRIDLADYARIKLRRNPPLAADLVSLALF